MLTSFRQGSLDTYLKEWRTIRASRVISQEDQSDQDEGNETRLLGGLAGVEACVALSCVAL